jgi:formamidopyrimidine-DNA glycosylase
MPELPEAEHMIRRLAEFASQAVIVRVRVLRDSSVSPQTVAEVRRRARGTVDRFARRAKNVLLHLETGWTVRVQLGMTGHVYWLAGGARPPERCRVLFGLRDRSSIVFEDARTFGSVTVHRTSRLPEVLAAYGPEPLDPEWRWPQLRAAAARRTGPVKPFLLDQTRVAGLGNIWAAESLFRARIHPGRPLPSLDDGEWRALHGAIRRTLARAVDNTFKVTAGAGDFPDADRMWLCVYGREGKPCRRCRVAVARGMLAGRATYWCPGCQRPEAS